MNRHRHRHAPPSENLVRLARRVRRRLLRSPDRCTCIAEIGGMDSQECTEFDLAGLCGLAAVLIADALHDPMIVRLGMFGAEHTEQHGAEHTEQHAWARVGIHVVDVTVRQFGEKWPAVMVAPWAAVRQHYRESDRGKAAIRKIQRWEYEADGGAIERLLAIPT
jgi:hypothetical protein